MLTSDERTWASLAHVAGLVTGWLGGLSFLGPLIIWIIKKDQSRFVDDQAKEALNFQIAVTIAIFASFPLMLVFGLGFVLLAIVAIGNIVFSIAGAMAANKGIVYRYPYTLRLIA